jgi:hypothetical protein
MQMLKNQGIDPSTPEGAQRATSILGPPSTTPTAPPGQTAAPSGGGGGGNEWWKPGGSLGDWIGERVVQGSNAIQDLMTNTPGASFATGVWHRLNRRWRQRRWWTTSIGRGTSDTSRGSSTQLLSGSTDGTVTPAINPAVFNMFWSTAIAPLIMQTQKQTQDANAAFAAMADPDNSSVGKYLPPEFHDYFKMVAAQNAAGANSVGQGHVNALLAAPGIQMLQDQINNIRNESMQSWLQSKITSGIQSALSSTDTVGPPRDSWSTDPNNEMYPGTDKNFPNMKDPTTRTLWNLKPL